MAKDTNYQGINGYFIDKKQVLKYQQNYQALIDDLLQYGATQGLNAIVDGQGSQDGVYVKIDGHPCLYLIDVAAIDIYSQSKDIVDFIIKYQMILGE